MATACSFSSAAVFRPQIKHKSTRSADQDTIVKQARARHSRVVTASAVINPDIKKDVEKVVDNISTADIKGKGVYCRCWRSATFPMCNGAHVKHNKETGDNVGPLIIAKE